MNISLLKRRRRIILLLASLATISYIQAEECHSLVCQNKGTCRHQRIPQFSGASIRMEYCDCDTARDENGIKYVGFQCEHAYNVNNNNIIKETKYDCTRNCQNGGACHFVDGSPLNQSCRCPPDFNGDNCEKIAILAAAAEEEEVCRDTHCENGSKCVANTRTIETCDCRKINNQLSMNDTHYAGTYCDVASTSICSHEIGLNGRHFCTNNGTCVKEGAGIWSCSCLDGNYGNHCEYEKLKEYEECSTTLLCENGGSCRVGLKNHGILQPQIDRITGNIQTSGQVFLGGAVASSRDGEEEKHGGTFSDAHETDNWRRALLGAYENLHHVFPDANKEFGEHCVCPDGFAGPNCEFKIQICPDGRHVCFHDDTLCIQDLTGNNYMCQCSEGNQGKFCQHKVTDICENTPCFNGATCEKDTDHCICPLGFHGPFCSYPDDVHIDDYFFDNSSAEASTVKSANSLSRPPSLSSLSLCLIVISSLLVSAVILFAVVIGRRRFVTIRRNDCRRGHVEKILTEQSLSTNEDDNNSSVESQPRCSISMTSLEEAENIRTKQVLNIDEDDNVSRPGSISMISLEDDDGALCLFVDDDNSECYD